jgi:hypothetical protein
MVSIGLGVPASERFALKFPPAVLRSSYRLEGGAKQLIETFAASFALTIVLAVSLSVNCPASNAE